MGRVDEALKHFEELEETFATPGWQHLVTEAREQHEEFSRMLMDAKDWGEVCEIRGQAMQLARFVNLPEITAMMKANLLAVDEDDGEAVDL